MHPFLQLEADLFVLITDVLKAFGEEPEIEVFKHNDYYSIIIKIDGIEKGHITINGKGTTKQEYHSDILRIITEYIEE